MSDYQKAINMFVKSAREEHESNTYTALYQHNVSCGGTPLCILGNYACHGNLAGRISCADEVFVHIKDGMVEEQHALDFIDYWVNRSPAASIFIEKDANTIYNQCATVGLNHPSNLVGFGLIGLRACYEKYNGNIKYRIKVFDKLKSLGFDEWEAFLFSFMIKQEGPNEYKFQTFNSDHSVVPYNISKVWLRNALAKKFVKIHCLSAKKCNSITTGGVQSIFGETSNLLNSQILKLMPTSKKGNKNYNPFKRMKEEEVGYTFTGDDELKELVNGIKELAA